jgi:hypothetical protein
MGIKRRRIERRFQKYKLVLKTKCTPCVVNKIFILDLLFSCAFCLLYKFIFLKFTFNSASFDTHKPHIVKKIVGPLLYIVHDPKYHDLCARGQWTKNIFFCVFHSFRWSSTYLCYIPFENAKKV